MANHQDGRRTRRRGQGRSGRVRIGRVSLYLHRSSWWVYFREHGQPQRKRIGPDRTEAEAVAAEVNAQLAGARPTVLSFTPVTVADLRQRWLEHHEHVLRSSTATLARYRTATDHLVRYVEAMAAPAKAHELNAMSFVRHLREIEVAPNGHRNTAKRRLRDKGVAFVLGACRSMYGFAGRQHMLPPYADNPFAGMRLDRMLVEDAKPIHVFSADEELAFFQICDDRQLPLFYMLARLGMRPGELVHIEVEDLDRTAQVLRIVNKPDLGWHVKTRRSRSIPLPATLLTVMEAVAGGRRAGVLFRRTGAAALPLAGVNHAGLIRAMEQRRKEEQESLGRPLDRSESNRVARGVWRDAGALKRDRVRTMFCQITRAMGRAEVTAPKSWRHTFATCMQEAGVDPLVRQLTLGHAPAGAGLGMTSHYTHPDRAFHRRQLQQVLDLRPATEELVLSRLDAMASTEGGAK